MTHHLDSYIEGYRRQIKQFEGRITEIQIRIEWLEEKKRGKDHAWDEFLSDRLHGKIGHVVTLGEFLPDTGEVS